MVYLDNAATTFPKPAAVYDAMDALARGGLGNPGRSGHRLARASEKILADGRHLLNQLFHGAGAERFVFTLNGTDAINMAIKGCLNPGDHVITGTLEHNSVLRPLAGLVPSIEIETTMIEADDEGYYRPEDVRTALRPNTRLVVLTHASNVLGTVQPVADIGTICRERETLFLVDAAQSAGCWPIDIEAMKIDLLASPGHKSLFGPTGTGFLYVGKRAALRSWREGGTGHASEEALHPAELPDHLEAGTANVLGIAGLVEGIRFIKERTIAKIQAHEIEWGTYLHDRLGSIPGIEVLSHGRPAERVALATFRCAGYSSQEVTSILDSSFDIAVRGGLHCAPEVHRRMGTFPDGAVRVSGSALSSHDDINVLAVALEKLMGNGKSQ